MAPCSRRARPGVKGGTSRGRPPGGNPREADAAGPCEAGRHPGGRACRLAATARGRSRTWQGVRYVGPSHEPDAFHNTSEGYFIARLLCRESHEPAAASRALFAVPSAPREPHTEGSPRPNLGHSLCPDTAGDGIVLKSLGQAGVCGAVTVWSAKPLSSMSVTRRFIAFSAPFRVLNPLRKMSWPMWLGRMANPCREGTVRTARGCGSPWRLRFAGRGRGDCGQKRERRPFRGRRRR